MQEELRPNNSFKPNALRYTNHMASTTSVHIVFGPLGAGKSTLARKISKKETAVRFCIDEWMIQLFGPDLPKSMSHSWMMERVARCESMISAVASETLRCGSSVVLDLGFMKVSDRNLFVAFASEAAVPAHLHYVFASHANRRGRILNRNTEKGETYSFEVTPMMFDYMDKQCESPTESELVLCTQACTD